MSKLNWGELNYVGKPFHIMGFVPRHGNSLRVRELTLDTPYVTGGWLLDGADTLLSDTYGLFVLGDRGPYGEPVPTPGVQIVGIREPLGRIRLRVYINGSEASAGWTSSSKVWVAFQGTA